MESSSVVHKERLLQVVKEVAVHKNELKNILDAVVKVSGIKL